MAKTKEKVTKNKEKNEMKYGTVNYPVGDFLIKVKNAAMAKNKAFTAPSNKQIFAIAEVLKKLGFLEEVKKDGRFITVSLVFKTKRSVITNLRLISKPGLRIYMGIDDIGKKRGPSTFIISSPKGVISTREAKKLRMGGEVIAEIW